MLRRGVFSLAKEDLLINELKTGNKQAVRYWYKLFFPVLLRLALQKVANKKDAEELVQETFINSLKQIQLFQQKSKLKTWMVSILYHEIADYYRKRYAKKALKIVPLLDEILQKPLLSSDELNQKVETVLAEMKKDSRDLLLLKYFDKKKVKEIAKKLKKTVKAVEADLFKARREFKDIYLAKGYLNR
ncbi:MAG: RNA polymerase sigma factor [Candidatus Pacebacteria bacterium]|nr:RNA polymerase sigma factor [Candidatus Paceibacterota bacterium]